MPVEPASASSAPTPIDMTRHEEQVEIGFERVPYRTVRIRRRIVTEVRLVEVEVRSEVLDIDWHRADPDARGDATPAPERLEFVLHSEEPEIRLVTVARERIVLHRVTVPGTTDVETEVRSERIAIEPGHPPGALPSER